MKIENKIKQLREKIAKELSPLIDSDYVYLDLPFHQNIGDLLIWEGTECFLSQLPYNCIYKASVDTFKPLKIRKDVIIIMHGGGNFGDIWTVHQKFRLRIIQEYAENRIIILPQTVFYQNELEADLEAKIMASHPNLTICARDSVSYNFLMQKKMASNILLLPDMAFCIPFKRLSEFRSKNTIRRSLVAIRKDKEKREVERKIKERHVYLDWPSYENESDEVLVNFWKLKEAGNEEQWSTYAAQVFRPYWIQAGCSFVSSYKRVYTNRLHVAILRILLHREVYILDNSYGKNFWYYSSWLSDVKGVKFITEILTFKERFAKWLGF